MGQTKSKDCADKKGTDNFSAQVAVNDIAILRRLAENEGPVAVSAYIDEDLNKWKTEQVKLAITGRRATGKSTFINTIRNLKPEDNGFAKTGSWTTTRTPTLYIHPKNDQITFYELPGYSSPNFKKEPYINAMNIYDYDFVFIFFNNVLSKDEVWLVGELRKLNKPFSLVQSKIDIDIENAIYDGKDQEMVIPEIKGEIEIALDANPELKDTKGYFLISARKPHMGEMSDLMTYIEQTIGFKAHALLFSLESITMKILERKYQILKKRIAVATTLAARISILHLSDLDVAVNIPMLGHEVRHYMRVFGAEPERFNTLKYFDHSLLKCRSQVEPTFNMEPFSIAKLATYSEPLLDQYHRPGIFSLNGPIISSIAAMVTHKFLTDMLKDIKDDAVLLHEHITKTNADHRM